MGPFDLLTPLPADRRGREPEANAWIELHNVIVAAEHLDDFGPEAYDRIQRQRRVDLAQYEGRRVALYQRYLDWTLEDGDFSETNRALLAHVAETLNLGSGALYGVHERAFGTAVHHALADDCLSVDERLLLYKLQHTLGLDPDLASGAYEVMARQRLLVTVARVLCDGKLSPDEADEVERAQAEIGVNVPPRVAEMLDEAAARWHALTTEPLSPPRSADKNKKARAASGARDSRIRFSVTGRWREVAVDRLLKAFGASGDLDAFERGDTFHYRVPAVALRGIRAVGRADVTRDRLVLDAKAEAPKVYAAAILARALRYGNGVLVHRKDGRALFVESDDDAGLHEALADMIAGRGAGQASWAGRWRPLFAPERDVALGRVSRRVPTHERPTAALGKLLHAGGWTGVGDLTLTGDTVFLRHNGDTRKVTVRNLRGVHLHKRLVWIDRRSAHDWLAEFRTDTEAQSFANALLGAAD